MKRLFLIALVPLILAPGTAMTNPVPWGGVGLYADMTGSEHFIYDTGPAMISVYVVTENYYEHVAVAFSAPPPLCFDASWIGETTPFAYIGDSQSGIEITYGACMLGPGLVLTINFFGEGLSGECCFYNASPHPDYPDPGGRLTAWACYGGIELVGAGYVVINPDPETLCNTPVEASTWGRVKALYR